MTFEKLTEQFEQFKKQNKLPKNLFLKLADARIGKRVAIFRPTGSGSIELMSGQFYSFSEFDGFMQGYDFCKQKRLKK